MAERRRPYDDAEPAPEQGGRMRLCAATREALDADRLIRFVADPTGEIVPDLARRLPGRGVWVKADKATLAQAAKANVFARSLKRAVRVPADLVDRVDGLLERRVLDALALANKAGLVTTGFQQVDALVETGTAAVLVQAEDAAPGGREKLDRKFSAVSRAKGREPALVTSLTTAQLSLAIGRSNVVHAALIQGGAARRLLDEAERLERYRRGSAASTGPESAVELEV